MSDDGLLDDGWYSEGDEFLQQSHFPFPGHDFSLGSELARKGAIVTASWEKMGTIRKMFDAPGSVRDIEYSPVRINRKRDPDTGELNETLEGGPYIVLDPPWPMPVRKTKSFPDGVKLIGKATFLTWTTKMSAPSFSLPAGPMQNGGTCPASVRESVERSGEYMEGGLHEAIPQNAAYLCDSCVTGDALLPIKGRGLVRLDQVVDEVLRGTRLEVLADHGWTRITKAWEKGLKKTVLVRSTCGHELRCTPDHKILTTDGWKEAQELEEADRIIVSPKHDVAEGRWPKQLEIPKTEVTADELAKGDEKPNYPTEWTREVGLALGYLMANGSVGYGRRYPTVSIYGHPDDERDLKEIASCINSWCGSKCSVDHAVPPERSVLKTGQVVGSMQVRWHRLSLIRFLDACGLSKRPHCSERRVPAALFCAPQEAVAGFISGMFSTDGSVLVSRPKDMPNGRIGLSLASVSRGLLQDIQLLLSNFGIRSTICEYKTSNEARVLVGYSRLYKLDVGAKDSIVTFRDLIGLHNKRKAALLSAADLEYAKPWSTRRYAIVKSVEKADEADVYDIEVEHDNHRFVANGLTVQNCYAGKNNYLMYKQVSIGQMVRLTWINRELREGGRGGHSKLASKLIEVIASLQDDAMAVLLMKKLVSNVFFRIHDSGDFHKPDYYLAWRDVAYALPDVTFWAPTRQWVFEKWREIFRNTPPPENLALRPSALFFGARPPVVDGMGSAGSTAASEVHGQWGDVGGAEVWNCPAYMADEHSCGSAINPDGEQGCRTCWKHKETAVNYKAH